MITLPFTGALIALTGIVSFFFFPDFLYMSMIFAVPFSATAVINTGWGNDEKGVAAWLFLGGLWVVQRAISGLPPWRTIGWSLTKDYRNRLVGFMAAVTVSLAVPLIINGTSWVQNPLLNRTEDIPLKFGASNITQSLYLAFGVLLALFVAAENYDAKKLSETLRIYVWSCVFAAAWGIFELWCNITGRTYPAYIFNNSATESAQGFLEVVRLRGGSLGRVSSVALEPSVLAQELLLALVVLLICLASGRVVISKTVDRIALLLITLVLLASTSSTSYVGLFCAFIFCATSLRSARAPWKPYVVIATSTVVITVIVYLSFPIVREIVDLMLLDKFQSGSGVDRLYSMKLAAQDFVRYPLLGTGWHMVPCWDLILLILANTGLCGFITFSAFLAMVLRNLWVAARQGAFSAVVLLPAIALMIVLMEVAGLTYAAGYVWLTFGLGAAAGITVRQRNIAMNDSDVFL